MKKSRRINRLEEVVAGHGQIIGAQGRVIHRQQLQIDQLRENTDTLDRKLKRIDAFIINPGGPHE